MNVDNKLIKEVSIELMEYMDLSPFIGHEENLVMDEFVKLAITLYLTKLMSEATKNIKDKQPESQSSNPQQSKKPKLTSKVDEAGNYVFDQNNINALLRWTIAASTKKKSN